MKEFGKHYYYHNGEIYVKVKSRLTNGEKNYLLTDKNGKRKWISLKDIESIIDKK